MKLYEVPRNTWVKVADEDIDLVVLFDHIDGAYSLCYTKDGKVIHLAAYTDVEIIKYE